MDDDALKYETQLKIIRARKKNAVFSTMITIPIAIAIAGLIAEFANDERWAILGFGLSFLPAFWFSMKCTQSVCPRCGRGFFIKDIFTSTRYSNKCVNCGLPLDIHSN